MTDTSSRSESSPDLATAFIELGEEWLRQLWKSEALTWLPRSAEKCVLACLLIAEEAREELAQVPRVAELIEECLEEEPQRSHSSWINTLPWKMCRGIIVEPGHYLASIVETLEVNFNHHSSGIRQWMMEIGWISRHRLTRSEGLPRLFENTAYTLAYYQEAFGLAATIATDMEEFKALAANYSAPIRFEDQYARRHAELEMQGLVSAQAHFWKLESELRAIIIRVLARRAIFEPSEEK